MGTRSGVLMALGALSLGVVAMTPAVSSASPANFGFENDLNGWTTSTKSGSSFATVVSDFSGYKAAVGKKFLLLQENAAGDIASASQTFDLTEGQTLTGMSAFVGSTTPSGYFVNIIIETSSLGISYSNFTLSNTSTWQNWSWIAPSEGKYKITYQIVGYGDGANAAMFDAVPVPIPGTAMILGSALLGLVGIGVRKNRASLV